MSPLCHEVFSLTHAQTIISRIREWYRALLEGDTPQPRRGEAWEAFVCEGLFVTLWAYPNRNLRGCIGTTQPGPAIQMVWHSAIQAAFNDPRFPPLQKWELDRVILELSILYAFEHVYPTEVLKRFRLGDHGLDFQWGNHRGLLLPEVAEIIQARQPEDRLQAVCRKAGLPPDAWENPAGRLRIFRSLRFVEKEPGGAILTF